MVIPSDYSVMSVRIPWPVMHQSFEIPAPPSPPLGDTRDKPGVFTSLGPSFTASLSDTMRGQSGEFGGDFTCGFCDLF